MSAISIFWIEDNTLRGDLTDREGIEVPALGEKEDGGHFLFKLFQHPVEVHEYLSLVAELNKQGLVMTWGDSGALPDIVVFDYKLADNFQTTNRHALSYRNKIQCEFLRSHSASVTLRDEFKQVFGSRVLFCERNDVKNGTYRSDEFKHALHADRVLGGKDEEFGLFAGIAIVREFKEHITVGVPATVNKADKSAMTDNALFYEWLNSYDIKEAIERPDKGEKNWDEILKFALPLLRRRIKAQVKSGKITPDYFQLMRLSNGARAETNFSFTSAYGERHLPLKGLFLDRTQTVKEWAKELIGCLPANDEVIKNALNVSNHLWDEYNKKFSARIDLSDYQFRQTRGGLDSEERKAFSKLKRKYCNGDDFKRQISIQDSFEKLPDKKSLRLTVLHLISRLAIQRNKCAVEAPNAALYAELTREEKFSVLFQFHNTTSSRRGHNNLLLPMHAQKSGWDTVSDGGRKWLAETIRFVGKAFEVTRTNVLSVEKWITPEEKRLLRAIFYQDKDFYPTWLS